MEGREERISELKGKTVEIIQSEQQRENRLKNIEAEPWNTVELLKKINIYVLGNWTER